MLTYKTRQDDNAWTTNSTSGSKCLTDEITRIKQTEQDVIWAS